MAKVSQDDGMKSEPTETKSALLLDAGMIQGLARDALTREVVTLSIQAMLDKAVAGALDHINRDMQSQAVLVNRRLTQIDMDIRGLKSKKNP